MECFFFSNRTLIVTKIFTSAVRNARNLDNSKKFRTPFYHAAKKLNVASFLMKAIVESILREFPSDSPDVEILRMYVASCDRFRTSFWYLEHFSKIFVTADFFKHSSLSQKPTTYTFLTESNEH